MMMPAISVGTSDLVTQTTCNLMENIQRLLTSGQVAASLVYHTEPNRKLIKEKFKKRKPLSTRNPNAVWSSTVFGVCLKLTV